MEKLEITKRCIERKDESAIVEKVEKLIEQYGESIGAGQNAEVFGVIEGEYGNFCVKKSFRPKKVLANSEEVELDFQALLSKRGVRVPVPFVLLENKKTKDRYIVMERIKGQTLGDIFEKGSNLEIPSNYNHESFWKKVDQNLELMHDPQDKYGGSVHHRDLHSRNIMIDEKGDPVFIDFGTACYGLSGDEDSVYRETVPVYNSITKRYEQTNSYYQKDAGKLKFMKEEIAKRINGIDK